MHSNESLHTDTHTYIYIYIIVIDFMKGGGPGASVAPGTAGGDGGGSKPKAFSGTGHTLGSASGSSGRASSTASNMSIEEARRARVAAAQKRMVDKEPSSEDMAKTMGAGMSLSGGGGSAGQSYEEEIEQMLAMGFEYDESRRALITHRGDVAAAIASLQ